MPLITRRAFALSLAAAGAGALSFPARGRAEASRLLEEVETEYNTIRVEQSGPLISMNFKVGDCVFTESAYDVRNPDFLPVAYTRDATAALAYPKAVGSVMEIGLGGGRLVSYLHRALPKTRIDAVEIDPGVVALAQKYFGVTPDARLRLHVADGRRFAMQTKEMYDVIFVDAFRGTWVPETLTTVEFFTLLKSRLRPGGVVAQNLEPTTLFYERMAATLFEVFGNVDAFRGEAHRDASNTMLVAYAGEPRSAASLKKRAAQLQGQFGFRHDLRDLVAKRRVEKRPDAAPLRDGFEEANLALMIDKANAKTTPRRRRAECNI